MRKMIVDFWKYIRFLVSSDDDDVKLFGIKLEASDYYPKDKLFLASVKDWSKEYEGVKIVAINLWSEGTPCDHTYKQVVTSKSHGDAMKTTGMHKDFICSKCGHSFCATVSEEALELSKIWGSIGPKNVEPKI